MSIDKKSNVVTISCDNLKEYELVMKALSGYWRYETYSSNSAKYLIVHIYGKYDDFLKTLLCRCVSYA